MLHALLILNPAAGRGAARRAKDPVARAFRSQGWTVELVVTERPGHATELARRAAQDGVERVVAVGGDGAVHEVANGLLTAGRGADVTLGVVPIGSGNDFAKLVGTYRHPPERAVARIVTAVPRRFDVGRALDEYFVNSMGFGFGPAVVRTRNAMPSLTGFVSYLVPVLREFWSFRPPRFDLAAAEHRETGYMMMVEVCNGTTAGGNYRFAPAADPADGRLDVCLIRRVSLPRFLLAIPRVLRGTHTKMKEVTLFRTRTLTIRCPEAPLLLHLDGELRETGLHECTVHLEPKRLKVLVAR
ncbi:MAG: diacylglycerol/lipid kinase family protein [Gemmatimonadales bacterium]